jgi:hypothetical protein
VTSVSDAQTDIESHPDVKQSLPMAKPERSSPALVLPTVPLLPRMQHRMETTPVQRPLFLSPSTMAPPCMHHPWCVDSTSLGIESDAHKGTHGEQGADADAPALPGRDSARLLSMARRCSPVRVPTTSVPGFPRATVHQIKGPGNQASATLATAFHRN